MSDGGLLSRRLGRALSQSKHSECVSRSTRNSFILVRREARDLFFHRSVTHITEHREYLGYVVSLDQGVMEYREGGRTAFHQHDSCDRSGVFIRLT